jgi:FMN phosphatase YigB (HAD superfamily)
MTAVIHPAYNPLADRFMVVFDLDGTLSDCAERVDLYLLDQGKGYPHKRENPDWDSFFLACIGDKPIWHAIEVLKALHDAGAEVWIWTGRSDIAKELTKEWLFLHGVPLEIIENRLVMRAQDDRRNDDEVKTEWIETHGKPHLIFEDRNRVVKAWREKGVPCYHVADADF